MLKNKSAIILLVIAIVCLLSGTVFATETEPKVYTAADGKVELNDVDITANGCDGVINVGSGAEVIINSGKVHAQICGHKHEMSKDPVKYGEYAMAIWADGGKVTINGGTFTNDPDQYTPAQTDLIYVKNGGEIIITGGSFKSTTPQWTLNSNDSKKGTIIVKGGKFFEFNPALAGDEGSNSYVGKGEIIIPDGYSVIPVEESDGTWYQVQELKEPEIIDGKTIELNKDITANGCDGAIYAKNGANVTITGGKVHAQICGDKHINNGKLGEYAMAVWADASKVTIKDGIFTNDADPYTPAQTDLIYVKNGGEIVIEGGEFKSSTPQWTLNSNDSKKGTIIVKGGKFYQFNPALAGVEGSGSYVGKDEIIIPEGYTVVQNGDWYEVVCTHKNLTKVDAKAATYTTEGNIEYYTCNCGKWFYDADATSVISSKLAVITPMLIVVENNNANVSGGAIDEAIKDSEGSSNIEIPVLESDKTVSTVTLPVESLKDVATADKGVIIETSEVTLTLDATTVKEIVKQTTVEGSMIVIDVKKVEDKVLNADQKDAIKNKDIAVLLSARILANGKEISNFGGGKIKVEIPFTPAEGTNGSDYEFIHITDDGKVEDVDAKYVDGFFVAELKHFSEYAIVKDAKSVAGTGSNPAAPAPAPSVNPNEKDDTPKTGAMSIIGLVVVMSVIGLAVLKRD